MISTIQCAKFGKLALAEGAFQRSHDELAKMAEKGKLSGEINVEDVLSQMQGANFVPEAKRIESPLLPPGQAAFSQHVTADGAHRSTVLAHSPSTTYPPVFVNRENRDPPGRHG